jgi:putative transposase
MDVMPRKARIDAPGALHHIIIRGIERKAIFKDTADRENFFERCGQIISETETGCYAWVYLTNHIHLNPLRAKVVKDLKDLGKYRWCGHSALMGKTEAGFQDIEYVLNLFGRSEKGARRAYESFVAKGAKHGRRPDLVGGGLLRSIGGWAELKESRDLGIRIKGDERLLGSSDFVERVLKQADEQLEEKYRLRVSAISLQGLMDKVVRYYKIEAENLKSSSKERRVTEARRILCYIAVRKLGYKCSDVSKAMGISAVTVSKAANLGSKLSVAGKIQKLILDN